MPLAALRARAFEGEPTMSAIAASTPHTVWPTLDEATLCAAFQRTVASMPEQTAIRTVGGDLEISWYEYGERVRSIAAGLAALGIGAGDVVALMLTNRPEHNLVDTAAIHLGAIPFSIYATYPVADINWLLERSEAKVVVTEAEFIERVLPAVQRTENLREVVLVDTQHPSAMTLAELEALEPRAGFDFESTWKAIGSDNPVTLIFTSGTTGEPKGVQHTHSSILFMLRALDQVAPVSPHGRVISFLPMAHIAERFISHYSSMVFGYTITAVPDAQALGAALVDARPTRLFGVPRIYEKLQYAVEAAIAVEADAARMQIAREAIALGLEKVRLEQSEQPVSAELRERYAAADASVLADLRARVGLDQLEWPSVGAAPTPYRTLEFFAAIGVPIQELWGMSEILLVTLNPPHKIKLGTVGPAMPGVGLRLADDGEILIGGGSVMLGYRNRPDLTAETVIDGWVHTGDIGTLDHDGYLKIIDRKKELIINSGGKNMSPARIEVELRQSSTLIGQAICIGDARLYNVALLTLDREAASAWAERNGYGSKSLEEIAASEPMRQEITTAVAAANEHLARVEQIKGFQLLDCEWLPGGDELTPTIKLRRKSIEHKYASEIEALYGG